MSEAYVAFIDISRRYFVMADIAMIANNKGMDLRSSTRRFAMKIAIRFLGLPTSEALRQHSERQAQLHLGRFDHELDTVEIRIRDVNGPRGGEDMECKVSARGRNIGFASMAELTSDAYGSVAMALSRLSRAVARALDRTRGMRLVPVRPLSN